MNTHIYNFLLIVKKARIAKSKIKKNNKLKYISFDVYIKQQLVRQNTLHIVHINESVNESVISISPKIVLPELDLITSREWIKKSKINFLKILNPGLKGPTNKSNWLIPNKFLVGGYPDTDNDLDNIKNVGITSFVCLNNEYGATSKYGRYHRPYANNLDSSHEFDNIPIPDMGVTDDKTILEISQKIVDRIRSGKIVYLHCSGGHGRTGTVACIVLYILYELPLDQILDYVQFAHDQRDVNFFGYRYHAHSIADPDLKMCFVAGQVPTPQTSTQRDQVARIIESLKQ